MNDKTSMPRVLGRQPLYWESLLCLFLTSSSSRACGNVDGPRELLGSEGIGEILRCGKACGRHEDNSEGCGKREAPDRLSTGSTWVPQGGHVENYAKSILVL